MSAYEQALLLLAAPGVAILIAALLVARRLDRLERKIAARKAIGQAAE